MLVFLLLIRITRKEIGPFDLGRYLVVVDQFTPTPTVNLSKTITFKQKIINVNDPFDVYL